MSTLLSIPIRDIRCRVFTRRETTAEQEARPYSYQDIVALLRSVRRELRATVANLPDGAFEDQPDESNGNEVWSAGQIVSHLVEAQLRFDTLNGVRNLVGAEPREWPPEIQKLRGERLLSRAETLFALDIADSELTRLFDDVPENADFDTIADAAPFGELSVRGRLLLTSLHEHLHVEQLRELGAASVE